MEESCITTPRWVAVSETVAMIEDDFKCPICLDFFREPVETSCCRQIFCRECFQKSCRNFTCPLCNSATSKEELVPCSKFFLNSFNEMTVTCSYSSCNVSRFQFQKDDFYPERVSVRRANGAFKSLHGRC